MFILCIFSFDINKLLISYETIAGFSIITDIEYDGESLDKGDYSTTTKEISLNVNQKDKGQTTLLFSSTILISSRSVALQLLFALKLIAISSS